MKREIDVHTGEIMVAGEETILKSDTNSACLVFVAYDAEKKIGGLAHAMMLSGRFNHKSSSGVFREAGEAIDEMVEDMTLLGADKDHIEVRLVTGENIPHQQGDPDYQRNISSAYEILKRKHIKCDEKTLVDVGRSHVAFDVSTGDISYA